MKLICRILFAALMLVSLPVNADNTASAEGEAGSVSRRFDNGGWGICVHD